MKTRPRNTLVVLALAAGLAAAPGSALGAPRVVSSEFTLPTVVGKETYLAVRAVDPDAPISGMSVAFGRPAQIFALSACRPADSSGRPAGGPFAPGRPVTLRAPHRFTRGGSQPVLARLDSGGCDTRGGSVYQPGTATPTRPGEPLIPPVFDTPVSLPELLPGGFTPKGGQTGGEPGGLPLPLPVGVPGTGGLTLPDTGDLPLPDTGDLPLPDIPLPDIPLPGLPRTASQPGRTLVGQALVPATAAARCKGAGAKVRNNRRSRRRAAKALLCVMNSVRRRAKLRRLRGNGRLARAATAHSRSMVRGGYFSHTAPGGVELTTRLRRVRYLPARRWLVGENLACGSGRYDTPISILRAWMKSPPHRANLLQGSFREVGLGLVSGQPGASKRRGATYTADFGYRRRR